MKFTVTQYQQHQQHHHLFKMSCSLPSILTLPARYRFSYTHVLQKQVSYHFTEFLPYLIVFPISTLFIRDNQGHVNYITCYD